MAGDRCALKIRGVLATDYERASVSIQAKFELTYILDVAVSSILRP